MKVSKATRSVGTLTLVNFTRKHQDKLRSSGNPEIAPLADRLQAFVEALDLAYRARRPLAALWTNAAGVKDAADNELDLLISEMSYELLGPRHLKGNRQSPLYRALFPEGNIGFIQGPDRAELVQVGAMVSYLKANPEHPMAERAFDLEAKAASLDAALGPVIAAESALRQAEAVEREQRDALRRAIRKSAALLRAELMDEKLVDAYFPSVAESTVAEDETAPAE